MSIVGEAMWGWGLGVYGNPCTSLSFAVVLEMLQKMEVFFVGVFL